MLNGIILGEVTTSGRIKPKKKMKCKGSELSYRYQNVHGGGIVIPINTKVYGHFEVVHGIDTFIVTYYEKNRIGTNKLVN